MNSSSSVLGEGTTLGRLAPGRHRRLCQLLTIGDAWMDLAEVIPNRKRTGKRFTGDDIELFKRDRDPADRLLRTWKTDNVTVGDLIRCLAEADLLRQAAYIKQFIQPSETKVVEIALPGGPVVDCACELATATFDNDANGYYPSEKSELQISAVSMDAVARWTRGFDARSARDGGCLLGTGGYADVFKGTDDSGKIVAIKKFKEASKSCAKQFENEINVQLKCKHENVLSLIGYCDNSSGRCIVYEYMCNGSLEEFLESKGNKVVPTIEQRLSITKDVAAGIAYLNDNNFIHRDIKSANILLNEAMRAKIGDFGITRSGPSSPFKTSTETLVLIGTTPYMAPEYLINGKLSFKTDSFSFGVVLLELLTGLPAYDTGREEFTLLEHVRETFDEENYYNMADRRVEFWDRSKVKRIYDMAMSLCSKEKLRPTVGSVLEDINSW